MQSCVTTKPLCAALYTQVLMNITFKAIIQYASASIVSVQCNWCSDKGRYRTLTQVEVKCKTLLCNLVYV